MFRPQSTATTRSSASVSPSKNTSNIATNDSSQSTIREIRSRTTSSNNSRQLLANRRQAMSMERLNGSFATNVTSALHQSSNISDKEKCSLTSGSNNSISGSTTSSPSRSSSANGLNRTASRVSRFRSAKAVFERLSSANNNNNTSPSKNSGLEKPRGNVASRYAAAAAARAAAAQHHTSSPRGRLNRSSDTGKTSSNNEVNRFPVVSGVSSPSKSGVSQPKPQPRVITTARRSVVSSQPASHSTQSKQIIKNETNSDNHATAASPIPSKSLSAIKPPPKDLIDKIVLEIALDAGPMGQDADCTIQNLSDCNISGIPETLDFDRCFQDVEMMTEEEARKLLSRKSDLQASKDIEETDSTTINLKASQDDSQTEDCSNQENIKPIASFSQSQGSSQCAEISTISIPESSDSLLPSSNTLKVRFSDELVQVYCTHAVEDYDRRNDDIDPVAASAEYEIEKSRERADIRDSDDEDSNDIGAVTKSGIFNITSSDNDDTNALDNPNGNAHTVRDGPQNDFRDSSDYNNLSTQEFKSNYSKEYVESLERDVNLKHILEQNLRDLQSQYYEAVKDLDELDGKTKSEITDLQKKIDELNNKYETSQNELSDAREGLDKTNKELNDIKESSQLLEKKYHRAKRIIKDMQSREESFTRREQLYQQKLDEIEYELGVLIRSVDTTIMNDGLKYYTMTDGSNCQRQHQIKLDVFGLIKQMLDNFSNNQSTQNAQIKQRVVTILEQQLANLIASSGNTSVSGTTTLDTTISSANPSDNSSQNIIDSNRHSQVSYPFASHRISQPNLPHPIGVGGQPTKIFHGPNPAPISLNEPSPPQSVNSYPSSNSLNSLNNHFSQQNNNNNNTTTNNNNNNVIVSSQSRDNQKPIESQINTGSLIPSTAKDDNFQPVPDIQVPYQANEWHDKPVSEWTTNQVSTWLLALGLDQYISKFEDRNVNGQSLINLDSTVLKGLGVLNSNDRNLLKKKIRELRVEMEKERKLIEKKIKETLKDKSKMQATNQSNNKSSWKKGLLS